MKEQKIVKIQNMRVRNRYPRLYGKNSRLPEHAYGHDINIVEITTDKGAVGWGRGHCNSELKEYVLGKVLTEIFDVNIGILDDKYHQLDIALHDLAGNILNLPVAKMINPDALSEVNCYDGAIYMNDISPDRFPGGFDAVINDCKYDNREFGYTAFKVKVGRGGMWMPHDEGLKIDIDIIRAIRKEFPDSDILIDANDKFSVQDTIDFMEAVKDVGIYWVEEPFAETVDSFKILREYLSKNSPQTLIADGESDWNIDLLIELAKEKLIDVFLMDTCDYGFTKWRKMLKTVEELGITASPHNWGEKLKTHYSAHLAAAFPHLIKTIEGVPDITEGILFDDYVLMDGKLSIPNKSGFGMDIYWARNID